MSGISRACCRLVAIAAELPIHHRLDRPLGACAVAAIGVYQLTISRLTRTTCLFHPSCSRRAQASLKSLGFKMGLRNAAMQLDRCDGDYNLFSTAQGLVTLRTSDGLQFRADEISSAIARRS